MGIKGVYQSLFDPVEFIYRLQNHIPDKDELMIRYYGYYSNASRGKRNRDRGEKKVSVPMGEDFPARKELRKRWVALIQKVHEVDPLCCHRCGSTMRIIAYIDQWEVILRILKHLKLWPPPQRERVKPGIQGGSSLDTRGDSLNLTFSISFDMILKIEIPITFLSLVHRG